MEFIWDNIFFFWFGTGFLVTLIANISMPDMFIMGDSDFEEGEWSAGLFVFFCCIGPFMLLAVLWALVAASFETAIEGRKMARDEAQWEEEAEAARKKAAETRLKKKEEIEEIKPEFVSKLAEVNNLCGGDLSSLDESVFQEVLRLAKQSKKFRKSDLTKSEKEIFIGCLRFARINYNRVVTVDESSAATLKQLSKALEEGMKKFGEKNKST